MKHLKVKDDMTGDEALLILKWKSNTSCTKTQQVADEQEVDADDRSEAEEIETYLWDYTNSTDSMYNSLTIETASWSVDGSDFC